MIPVERRALLGRRGFLTLGIGAFVVASLPRARRGAVVTRRTLPVMGTLAEVVVVGRDEQRAQGAIDAAMAELLYVDRTMSRFRPASDIGRVNAEGASRAVPIGEPTALVLSAALGWASASDGAFDPAIGRVVALWNVNEAHAPPATELVTRLAGRSLYRQVQLGGEARAPTVAFTSPDVALDLGAIAKGYAVDRAIEALRARGIVNALVNVGGDLYAAGTADDGAPWRVGIQAPSAPGALLGSIEVQDRAIATSGDYEQGFGYRGVRYHHLMDPATAAPRRVASHSVTIEAASCMDADAAATTVFGWTSERARAVLAVQAPGARVVSWG